MNGRDSERSLTYHHSLITDHKSFRGALVSGLGVVAFCLLLLWHDPLLFWNDDYEISILPVFADVARSWSEGQLPLLSPYSWVCGNLAGEYQYGTFSVFVNAVVVLIWKFPLSFPQQAAALSIAHLFVLAMGGYLLARGRQISSPLSMMVALVTALNGWIICWGATDWFGALGAFTWFPWAWWSMERALDARRGGWRFLWPAPFVYLLVTGAFPYIVLMLAVLAAWLSVKSFSQTRSVASLGPLVLGLLLGIGLSSPAWLALLDYVRGSAREVQESAAHFQWVVPLSSLPAFILPSWTVNWADFSNRLLPHTATEMACGLVSPIALFAGLVTCGRVLVRRIKWELGLLVLILIISLLPSVNMFRWSFRWLPFLHVVLALCAAETLRVIDARREDLTAENAEGAEEKNTSAFSVLSAVITPGWFGVASLGLVVVASLCFRTLGERAFPFAWISLGLAAGWALLERTRLRTYAPAIVTFFSLLATYLCISPNCGVPKYNLDQRLIEPAPLNPQRLYLSMYDAPEVAYRRENKPGPFGTALRIGSTSMWGGVHLLNGYSPVGPSGVAREFDFATHGHIRPDIGRSLLETESGPEGKLARLGVDGIIVASEFGGQPQPESEWELAVVMEEGRVFHRRSGALSRLRSVRSIDSRPNEQFASADISRVVNDRHQLMAEVTVPPEGAPALLTVSRPFFNGYQAKLGDVPLKVDSYRGLMPLIEIPAGMSGRLTLVYRPWWLVWGGAIAALSLLVMTASAVAAVATRTRRPSGQGHTGNG